MRRNYSAAVAALDSIDSKFTQAHCDCLNRGEKTRAQRYNIARELAVLRRALREFRELEGRANGEDDADPATPFPEVIDARKLSAADVMPKIRDKCAACHGDREVDVSHHGSPEFVPCLACEDGFVTRLMTPREKTTLVQVLALGTDPASLAATDERRCSGPSEPSDDLVPGEDDEG